MSGINSSTSKQAVTSSAVDSAGGGANNPHRVDGMTLLPAPLTPAVTDDLATSLAVMMMSQKHDDRVNNETQARASAKAQEEAHARKIAKMHELADDTFAEGFVEGVTEGIGAAATGLSTYFKFRGDIGIGPEAKALSEKAGFIDAGGQATKAAGKLISSFYKRDQELDRADMAQADHDIDKAKSASDAASTQSRRDEDDIRETINAVRSYLNAKSQLQQAGIMRG